MIYRGVSDGLAPPGIEFYLPLFFDTTDTLLDYLPADTVVCAGADMPAAVERAARSIAERYEERRHDVERPVLAPDELYLAPEELQARLDTFTRIDLESFKIEDELCRKGYNFPTAAPQEWRVDLRAERPLAPLENFLDTFPGRVLLAADSAGRREVLLEMLRTHGLKPAGVAGWHEFVDSKARIRAVHRAGDGGAQHRLTADRGARRSAALRPARAPGTPPPPRRNPIRRPSCATSPRSGPGSPVVHEEYGVGRYIGLQVMQVAGQDGEFVVLEYAGGDKLYVPVQQLHLVSRYSGAAPESAPLHKLGTDQWAKARKRAADKIRDVAAELLDLYAQRQAKRGPALPQRELEYQAFASSFPFEETADQAEAIRQVLQDLDEREAHGSRGVRRRGLRQDRGGDARGVHRRAGGQAGGGARAHHAARRAAHQQFPRPLRRLAGAHRIAVAFPHRQGIERGARRHRDAARSTSSSPRSGCCTPTCASRISGSSSSTRNTASACATRRS